MLIINHLQSEKEAVVTPLHGHPMISTESANVLEPSFILTPHQLAEKLHKPISWIYAHTRRSRTGTPLPHLPMSGSSRSLLFYYPDVCDWLTSDGVTGERKSQTKIN